MYGAVYVDAAGVCAVVKMTGYVVVDAVVYVVVQVADYVVDFAIVYGHDVVYVDV